MHTDAFHTSLTLIQALAPIVPRLRALDAALARELRQSATAIPRALAAAELASQPRHAARHRHRALALARHVLALLCIEHAWHHQMYAQRSAALARAGELVAALGGPA